MPLTFIKHYFAVFLNLGLSDIFLPLHRDNAIPSEHDRSYAAPFSTSYQEVQDVNASYYSQC
jgi:hypothetical protein